MNSNYLNYFINITINLIVYEIKCFFHLTPEYSTLRNLFLLLNYNLNRLQEFN